VVEGDERMCSGGKIEGEVGRCVGRDGGVKEE